MRSLAILLFATLVLRPDNPALAQQFSAQTASGQIERSRLPNPALPLAPGTLSAGQPAEASGNNANSALAPAASGDGDLGEQDLLRAPSGRLRGRSSPTAALSLRPTSR